MRLSLRWKLFLFSALLIAASMAVADGYLTRAVEARLTAVLREDLHARARLVAEAAKRERAPVVPGASWDAFARAYAKASACRVTIVADDGRVVGDSEVDPARLGEVENHGARPEIAAARTGNLGEDTRLSVTISQRLLYLAVPFAGGPGDGVRGFARVARPLVEVEDAIRSTRRTILYGSSLALVLALVLSTAASHRMTSTLESLTEAARRMTSGDLAVRSRLTSTDELGALGRGLDALASGLSASLRELRAERDLLGSILEGMQEGVLVLDGEGRIVLMNSALRAMTLLGTEAVGKLFLEVVRQADLDEILTRAREVDEVVLDEIDLPGIVPRKLIVRAAPIGAAEGRGVLAVFVDVTDLRRLESVRREFVANVSHELRTPVTSIKSASETLQAGAADDPEARTKFLSIVVRNADRLGTLIEDLLELSRLDAKQVRLREEPVSAATVVGIVLSLFRERAEQKRISLVADVPKDMPTFRCDARAIEQILVNLVDNAVKYCPPGSTVRLAARVVDDRVLFDVEDDGPGIAEKHLGRLFERFYRVDAGRSRDVGGTGLGLSIVKHLAEALSGDISVKSTVASPGAAGGSTFTVSLPRT